MDRLSPPRGAPAARLWARSGAGEVPVSLPVTGRSSYTQGAQKVAREKIRLLFLSKVYKEAGCCLRCLWSWMFLHLCLVNLWRRILFSGGTPWLETGTQPAPISNPGVTRPRMGIANPLGRAGVPGRVHRGSRVPACSQPARA